MVCSSFSVKERSSPCVATVWHCLASEGPFLRQGRQPPASWQHLCPTSPSRAEGNSSSPRGCVPALTCHFGEMSLNCVITSLIPSLPALALKKAEASRCSVICTDSCALQVAPWASIFMAAVSGPENGILWGRTGERSAFRSRYNTTSVDPNSSGLVRGRGVGERLLLPFRWRLLLQTQPKPKVTGVFTVEMLAVSQVTRN